MPEEVITNPAPEVVTTQSNVAPNIDSELDAALSKSFKNIKFTEESNEPAKEEPKAEKNPETKDITIELKKPSKETKEVKSEEKLLEKDSNSLPTPESLDESPQGKGQAAWNALKNNYKRSFKSIEQKDQEITKLKASLAEKSTVSQKESETLKTQIDELSKYRAMVDIQADPDFISKFDQPIQTVKDSIKGLFKTIRDKSTGNQISDDIINGIDFTNTPIVDAMLDHIEANGDKTTAKRIARKIEELAELNDKRNETLSDQKKNYKELLENKKKEAFSKEAEGEGRIIKHLENLALGKDRSGEQKFPAIEFLNKINAKEGATQLEMDQVNEHNKMVELMHQKIRQGIKITAPEDKAEMLVAAVGSYYLSAKLRAAVAQINSLQTELKKISNVGSETEKTKSPSVSRNRNGELPDLDTALANFRATR